jgi:hypothetical protein
MDLGLHPSGEPRPSPAFRGALGDSGRKKHARNGEENSRASCGPDLSVRVGGRRPHRLVFRASSSSPRASSSARCKSCRRWTVNQAARRVNVSPPIYSGLPRLAGHIHQHDLPKSTCLPPPLTSSSNGGLPIGRGRRDEQRFRSPLPAPVGGPAAVGGRLHGAAGLPGA